MSSPEESRKEFYYDGTIYHFKVQGTEEQLARAKELLESGRLVEAVIQETGVSVVTQNGVMTRESIQREAERLYEKARHDEAQALYHAKQEEIHKINIEVAQKLLAMGMPLDEIIEVTDLSRKEIEDLR